MLYNERKNEVGNNILSATKPKDTILKTSTETKPQLKTRLKQKTILKVYIIDDKYYIDHSAAFVLGLIKTRAIMMDKPKLISISSSTHEMLKQNDSIEIEYIKMEKKQTLKIYVDSGQYCIDNGAAYALGLLTVEEFNKADSKYYYITNDMLNGLKEKYDLEFNSLKLEEYSTKNK